LNSKYYETDLVTTEDIFNVTSLADYLILEPIYKMEFYSRTLQIKDVVNGKLKLSVNEEVERIIKKIAENEPYNSIFANLYNFVRQEYDNNYSYFLSELITNRYYVLEQGKIISVITDYATDTEGMFVWCYLKEPEGRRYFHMVHGHIKFMETKDKMDKEKNQTMRAMMDTLGAIPQPPKSPNLSVDIFAIPPPTPEEQKMVQEMFKKMMEASMKKFDTNMKKDLEYEQLKKTKEIFDADTVDIDDIHVEEEYDLFDMDEDDDEAQQGK
jgi:hypothetical protein